MRVWAAAMVAAMRVSNPQKVCAPWQASSIWSVISLKVVSIAGGGTCAMASSSASLQAGAGPGRGGIAMIRAAIRSSITVPELARAGWDGGGNEPVTACVPGPAASSCTF